MPPKRLRGEAALDAEALSSFNDLERAREEDTRNPDIVPSSSTLLAKHALDYPEVINKTRASVAFLPLPVVRELLGIATLLYKDICLQLLTDRAHYELVRWLPGLSAGATFPTARSISAEFERGLPFDLIASLVTEEIMRDCLSLAAVWYPGMWRVVTQKEDDIREEQQRVARYPKPEEKILDFEKEVQDLNKILEEHALYIKKKQQETLPLLETKLFRFILHLSKAVCAHSHHSSTDNALEALCEIAKTGLKRKLPVLRESDVFKKDSPIAISDMQEKAYKHRKAVVRELDPVLEQVRRSAIDFGRNSGWMGPREMDRLEINRGVLDKGEEPEKGVESEKWHAKGWY